MKLKVYVIDFEMSARSRKIVRHLVAGMAVAITLAIGGAIAWGQQWTVWKTGDVLDADKLNANFDNLQAQINSRWALDGSNNLHNSNTGGLVGIGTSSPSVALDVNGQVIRKIARAHGNGPSDQTSNGALASRLLQYTKSQDATALRITWSDNIRCYVGEGSCEWEIKVDGSSCTSPGPLRYDIYSSGGNFHHVASVVGTCLGIPKGPHTLQLYVKAPASIPDGGVNPGGAGSAYTGFNAAYWSLEVEEVY
jgi:hypothetical protein